jgi:MoxR-like ATPase
MPSDITGTEVSGGRATGKRVFKFCAGPIFANVILADEINRTPPKTQAALLEAMQEHQVTVGGSATSSTRRSSCWRRRTRSSRRAPIRCPRRSSTASCSW